MHSFESVDAFEITNRGTVYTVLPLKANIYNPREELVGEEVEIDGTVYTCRGVEMYCKMYYFDKPFRDPIGLLV